MAHPILKSEDTPEDRQRRKDNEMKLAFSRALIQRNTLQQRALTTHNSYFEEITLTNDGLEISTKIGGDNGVHVWTVVHHSNDNWVDRLQYHYEELKIIANKYLNINPETSLVLFDITTTYTKGDWVSCNSGKWMFDPSSEQNQFSTGIFPATELGWKHLSLNPGG